MKISNKLTKNIEKQISLYKHRSMNTIIFLRFKFYDYIYLSAVGANKLDNNNFDHLLFANVNTVYNSKFEPKGYSFQWIRDALFSDPVPKCEVF